MLYDLIIVGGGPAGVAAGIYAARKKIKTVLITDSFGGQSFVSDDIQNWIGEPSISGFDLAKKLEAHLRAQEEIEITTGDKVVKVGESGGVFSLATESGKNFQSKTVLLASGSRRRKLEVLGEREFEGKGVFYCSICDAPIMKNKIAAVVGGGNAGLEAAVDLLPYAVKIYLLHRREELKGDPITQEAIKNNPKVEIILNAEIQEIIGAKFVEKITYKDTKTNELKTLPVNGVFVEIGALPESEIVSGLAGLNERGEVIVDHKTQRTSKLGLWACGDVSDMLYKQNNASAGDAVKAALNIYDYLNKNK